MTEQEIFDTFLTKMVEQGEGSTSGDGSSCAYRGVGNSGQPVMCGVGHFIPDSVYRRKMDISSMDVRMIVVEFGHILPPVITKNVDLMDDLQTAHDCAVDGEDFIGRLLDYSLDIAGRWGFDCTVLDRLEREHKAQQAGLRV